MGSQITQPQVQIGLPGLPSQVSDLPDMEDLVEVGAQNGSAAPPPESSWVIWNCTVDQFTDYRQIRHKPLAGTTSMLTPSVDGFGSVAPVESDTTTPTGDWMASVPDIFQQVCTPSLVVVLEGFAVRIGYRINPPQMLSFGGQSVVLKSKRVREMTMGITGNLRIYRTEWRLVYLVESAPGVIPLPANPLLTTDGEGQQSSSIFQSGIPGGG